jgi:hypothetical protein
MFSNSSISHSNASVIWCSSYTLFFFAKNKWSFVLIHDLIIPSLVTGRFLSGFEWFSIGFDLIELTKLMVCFQQEVLRAQFRI